MLTLLMHVIPGTEPDSTNIVFHLNIKLINIKWFWGRSRRPIKKIVVYSFNQEKCQKSDHYVKYKWIAYRPDQSID